MSSIAALERLQAQHLAEIILAEAGGEAAADPTFAIIDVRDDGNLPPWSHRSPTLPRIPC
jgi:hypothetical protein